VQEANVAQENSGTAPEHSLVSWYSVTRSKQPLRHFEAALVQIIMADAGPDISFRQVGAILRRLRPALRAEGYSTALDAYEDEALEDIMEQVGLFGPVGDIGRDEGDKFF